MNKKGNGMVIGLIAVLVILGVVMVVSSSLMKPSTQSAITPTPMVNKADIDRSGAADEGDRRMIQKNFTCEKTQPCWNSTVGKTKDGDNPLYVFDLDLNGDGSITQADVDLVQ